jgi:hypothetical protein
METICRIKKLTFNEGTGLEVSPNDIVVFVGANNSGKSQSLKDINKAFVNSSLNIVVKQVEFEIEGVDKFEGTIKKLSSFNKNNGYYSGYGFSIHSGWIGNLKSNSFSGMEQLASFFVKQLDTRDRLNQCDPVGVIDRDEPKAHPLHYLANSPELRKKIDKSFYEAFAQHLQIERFGGKNNFMRIGDDIKRLKGEGVSLDDDLDNATKILDTYPKLHEQGDGMVGFTGVLLSLLIENYSVFLIDEPESFLHPPQARILGTEIPELLGNRQAFISTHSEHLLKGLLEAAPERIKVVRITRKGNENGFSIINTDDISKIWKDTLLRQSNVLQGLFYDAVVICESDSDCQFYSSILTYIKEQQSKRDNTFFVYGSTKSRLKVIVEALRPLNVEFRVIADLDLLRDKNDVKPLLEACGGNWELIKDDYTNLSDALRDEKNTICKEDLKQLFIETIDNDGKNEYDKTSLQELKSKVSLEKKWKPIKKQGVKAIPPDAKCAFNRIDAVLKQHKIFLVPNGELEGFVSVGGHGPGWVANVIETYPDYGNTVFNDARSFVGSWGV